MRQQRGERALCRLCTGMSLDACATLVARGDPLRWSAVLAAPPAARPILLPIYAANLEIARAPYAASEPMIAEMRVQWWVDALTEIADDRPVRAHEVTTPLADAIGAPAATDLIRMADARRRDCWNDPVATPDDFRAYLRETGGALMRAAAAATGSAELDMQETLGTAAALAAYLLARPDLASRGRDLARDLDAGVLSDMAGHALTQMRQIAPRGPATLTAYAAPAVLARAACDPSAIDEGRLAPSEFRRRFALIRASLTGRV